MSAQQFESFMTAQIAAIEASGLEPEVWVERYAEAFRTEWEMDHVVA